MLISQALSAAKYDNSLHPWMSFIFKKNFQFTYWTLEKSFSVPNKIQLPVDIDTSYYYRLTNNEQGTAYSLTVKKDGSLTML